MLTASVVIWPPREHNLSRKIDAHNPSDMFNGPRFAALTQLFWHSRPLSASGVTLLAFEDAWGDVVGPNGCIDARAPRGRGGLIRVKFKLFSFLGNTRRTRRQPCTSKSTTSESARSRNSRRPRTYCASFPPRRKP